MPWKRLQYPPLAERGTYPFSCSAMSASSSPMTVAEDVMAAETVAMNPRDAKIRIMANSPKQGLPSLVCDDITED